MIVQYRVTQADPLIIERTPQAHADTIAYLEERSDTSIGRTSATRAGFDFTGTAEWPVWIYLARLLRRPSAELPIAAPSSSRAAWAIRKPTTLRGRGRRSKFSTGRSR